MIKNNENNSIIEMYNSFYHGSRSDNLVADDLAKWLFKLISFCNGHHDFDHRFGFISSS